MGQKTGFPPPYLVTSTPECPEKARQVEVARNVIAIIEECRADLARTDYAWVVQILDMALLQLSMNVNDISEDELRSLTDALQSGARLPTGFEDRA